MLTIEILPAEAGRIPPPAPRTRYPQVEQDLSPAGRVAVTDCPPHPAAIPVLSRMSRTTCSDYLGRFGPAGCAGVGADGGIEVGLDIDPYVDPEGCLASQVSTHVRGCRAAQTDPLGVSPVGWWRL